MESRPISRRESLRLMGVPVAGALAAGCSRPRMPEHEGKRMLTVKVANEFGKLRAAIVHDGGNAIDVTEEVWKTVPKEERDRHPETGVSYRDRLIEQHAEFRKVLAAHGVELHAPETQKDAFCQVFTRDPCFAVGDTLYVGTLRDPWRHAETLGLKPLRDKVERVVEVSGPGVTIEGGDVMVLPPGNVVLVGVHEHTTDRGFKAFSDALARRDIGAIPVPHTALHLDCCLAPLPTGGALYAAEKLPKSSVAILAKVFGKVTALDQEEARMNLAANMFWLDENHVVSGTAATKTNALLRGMKVKVTERDFTDLVRLWGSFRCVVCPLRRE